MLNNQKTQGESVHGDAMRDKKKWIVRGVNDKAQTNMRMERIL